MWKIRGGAGGAEGGGHYLGFLPGAAAACPPPVGRAAGVAVGPMSSPPPGLTSHPWSCPGSGTPGARRRRTMTAAGAAAEAPRAAVAAAARHRRLCRCRTRRPPHAAAAAAADGGGAAAAGAAGQKTNGCAKGPVGRGPTGCRGSPNRRPWQVGVRCEAHRTFAPTGVNVCARVSNWEEGGSSNKDVCVSLNERWRQQQQGHL